MQEKEPEITITQKELDDSGFTLSGKARYKKSVEDYSKTLYEKSISYGEIDKAETREVTHDHVKSAAHSIANSFGRPTAPSWLWAIRLGQYGSAIVVGVTSNNLSDKTSLIIFVGAFLLGSILFLIEEKNKQ